MSGKPGRRPTFFSTFVRGLVPALLSLLVLAIPVILTATPGGLLLRVSILGFLVLGLSLALAQAGPIAAFGLSALGQRPRLRTVLSLATRRFWRLVPGATILAFLFLAVPEALRPLFTGSPRAGEILLGSIVLAGAIALTAWLLLIVPAAEILEESSGPIRVIVRQRELPRLRRPELFATSAGFWLALTLPFLAAGLASSAAVRAAAVSGYVPWILAMFLLVLPALSATAYARALDLPEGSTDLVDASPRTPPVPIWLAAIPIVLLSLPGLVALRDSLLLWSAERGVLPAARVFQALGGELDRGDAASLSRLAARGDVRRVKAMIALGAPVNESDGFGKTPLHYASESGQAAAMRLLLQAGANPNTHANGGVTPLMAAVARGHVEASVLLLEARANAGSRDAEGMTTLMYACSWSGKAEIVNALLSHGADPAATDRKGRRATDFARAANRPDLERLLQPVETVPTTP